MPWRLFFSFYIEVLPLDYAIESFGFPDSERFGPIRTFNEDRHYAESLERESG